MLWKYGYYDQVRKPDQNRDVLTNHELVREAHQKKERFCFNSKALRI